jgi:hypothetical protein
MSVYDVDGDHTHSRHPYGNGSQSNLILESEQDLGSSRHVHDTLQPYGTAASRSSVNTALFPQAQPYEHTSLAREPSIAYSIQGQESVEHAVFPQPLPSRHVVTDELVEEPLTPVSHTPHRGVQLVDEGYVPK